MQNPVSDTTFKFIADYFSVPVEQITTETVANDFGGWDSMANAEIILGLEDSLGVELEPEDLFEFDNVGSMIRVFEKRAATIS